MTPERIFSHIYKIVDTGHFSFDDCMKVFNTYFSMYHDFTGEAHPVPGYSQVAAIMEKMPFADSEQQIALDPEDYEALITAYFLTFFPKCDRNIAHFFSGKIREYRYHEIFEGG